MPSLKQGAIEQIVSRVFRATAPMRLTMKVRRLLVNRNPGSNEFGYVGTLLPAPFDQTSLALRTMVDHPNRVVTHYGTRLATNQPNIAVIPLTTKTQINATAERTAGEQERLDNQMWMENGGEEALQRLSYAMSIGGKGYLLTLPRDASYGLPDRVYYANLTDDDVERMKREKKITRVKVKDPKTGQLMYAEPGDVWGSRRKEAAKNRAIDGRGLFTLSAYPMDMVISQKDQDGTLKWAAIVEEIPGDAVAEGSELAESWARKNGRQMDDWSMYGIFTDKSGRIVGAINTGGPVGTQWNRDQVYTLVRWFDRNEYVIYVCPQGQVEGGLEVWRGEHGCTVQGVPACPVEEVKFFSADTDVPGMDCSTPVSNVMAYASLLNQLMTLGSNAATFNGIPRWVIQMKDGSTLRGEDGQPIQLHSGQVPGLDPNQAAAYPGELVQLTIKTEALIEYLKIYFERMAEAMPSPITTGAAGTSGAAWTANLLINQAQQDLIQPSKNICNAVTRIAQRWHGWMRSLDVPVYFYAAPGHRKSKRDIRGLIEFDPKNFVDSITATQDLDTPEEATVRLQMGIQLLQAGPGGTPLITMEQFYDEYAKSQDARQSVIDYWTDQVVGAVMGGRPAAPGSVVQIVADGVRGQLYYDLINAAPNFALQQAENIVNQARMQAQAGQQQMGSGEPTGNVAEAAGIRRPGMGMATTLQGQLGAGAPGNPMGAPGVMA